MYPRFQEHRIAIRPFVTRALRGPRRRRTMLAAALLSLLVVITGGWVALSPGYAAHDARVELDLERNRWDRERLEFLVFVDSERDRDQMMADEARGFRATERRNRAEEAWMLLDHVASPHAIPPRGLQDLQHRARRLRDERADLAPLDGQGRYGSVHFDWYAPRDHQRLRAVVDAELEPAVVVYRSPLTMRDAVRLIGLFAGGLWLVLLMICAPLWVGTRLAQELNDNTLQPLTGTALTARQLTLGLIAGPIAPIVIVAAPVVLLILCTAAGAGRVVPALGFLASSTAMGALLVGLSMLGALAVGQRRAPGLVGIGLLALLGPLAMLGVGAGLHITDDTAGLVTILPGMGPVHLLAESFNPVASLRGADVLTLDLKMGLATVGAVILSLVMLRGIERWLGGTHRSGAINRVEAGIAALVLAVLAMTTVPSVEEFGQVFFIGLAVILVPLQLVVMGRVPGGDVPATLRQVPTARVLGEYAAWLAVAFVVALVVAPAPETVRAGLPIGLLHLGWALAVFALVTIRGTALPTSIPAKLWLVVCLGFAMLEYGTAVVWCVERPDAELLFPLAAASPLLGLVHVVMVGWIPVSLVRALSRGRRAAASAADPS